ncbi:MAG TPA: Crp/Fnr family transcriptional regulator [Fimbriimonadaceae bacterium]|nr:Crp/Fnr family transcriptional regulator [Fimbriimonadaceae bacterium]
MRDVVTRIVEGDMADFPDKPTKLQVLRASTLLNSLTSDETEHLAATSHLAYAERGEAIWLNGSEVDFFGIVGIGFVKMLRSTATGHDVTTELMGPGQVFGLLGAIDGTGCPQTAQAVCNTWYLKVNNREFLSIYRENTVLKEHLVRRTSHRLRNSFAMLARMSTGRVEQRIAAILFMLADSYGAEDGDGITLEVPLTRQDIAEMTGTTVETAIRVMSAWQKKGWLATSHKQITLVKPKDLSGIL